MGIRDDRFWADFLGVTPSDWDVPGISIRPHSGLAGFWGVWCFRCREHTVISAPTDWVAPLERKLVGCNPALLFEETFLRGLFGHDFDRLIGPAFQGCLDPNSFRHTEAGQVRPLLQDDLDYFCKQCNLADVEDSGIHKTRDYRMGYWDDATLAAVAGYRPWNDSAGDPCILTHQSFRGRGFGTAVTGAVVHHALHAGKLLLYQTLEANSGAVRIALRLGYEQYARHVAVRLRNNRRR